MKATLEESTNQLSLCRPLPSLTFWGQPFNEEIDYAPILANFRELFAANKAKRLEVADLFDIK
ncbi:hypothetical protein CR513_05390, partial [Mucuna pruriens]